MVDPDFGIAKVRDLDDSLTGIHSSVSHTFVG